MTENAVTPREAREQAIAQLERICEHCEQLSDDVLCAQCRARDIRICGVCGSTGSRRSIEDDVCERCLDDFYADD